MFTFGIFTTHIPYIAMFAFYAYFLLFGVNRLDDSKIEVADKSHSVQIHIDNSVEQAPANTYSFYAVLLDNTENDAVEKSKIKQKWKHFGVNKTFPEDHPENALFGRPPPVLA